MAIARSGFMKLLAIGSGGLVVLAAFNWQSLLLIVALLISAFSYHPPITKDLGDWGKPEFTSRLARTFPTGTPETVVIETLRRQRFSVDARARTAGFKGEWLPCNVDYKIQWATDAAGRLTSIEGDHIMVACL